MKKRFKILLLLICSPLVIVGGFLGYMTITDYVPPNSLSIPIEHNTHQQLDVGVPFTVTSFNIGYAGLDKKEDFFMDGGTDSHGSSQEQVMKNLEGITQVLKKENSSFFFLQEVDIDSSRSFHVDELAHIKKHLPNKSVTFALNYTVPWVPVPVFDPHGSTQSGLATLSEYKTTKSTRFSLYGKEAWPQQLFDLDRCIMENRVPLKNGKELLMVNVHLSAYDKGGKVRKQQLQFLQEYMNKEYARGNYIVLGGDWNHQIPGTNSKRFKTTEAWPDWMQTIPSNFAPSGFKWVADPTIPTSRTLARSYQKGVNFLSNIDGFIVSPNVKVMNTYGHSLGFEHSDHNPVTTQLVLK
ncbi:endonuclease/exonuclease/phosphatase family protein [Marininema halotolerans]|uniref:Metal-dependent hydrolase, endonuclease/exonuclease/phosphatase family n=1 Tax=Marininema halotolerans TaxID=1155944 RepID=A0A1I6PZH8_9BACL|nr:endonuclease/exonuclease/phosphatase family protein [Marininema halotolerans]SFS45508.1 Metal-dependent hydrolase, endonuclease/exonuclease/phosphatase family [Marininema halotolerans]